MPKPAITHRRWQLAVGQGCFHAGFVGPESSTPMADDGLRYIYDCGSLHKAALAAAVERYHLATNQAPIDFLFLSHLHADHVNGIKQLCTVGVDTVVLPLLNAVDRLISFAHAASEADAGDLEFMGALAADPVGAIADALAPRQIIVVRRGEGDASGLEAGFIFGPEDRGGERRGQVKWSLIRSSTASSQVDGGGAQIGDSTVYYLADSAGVAIDIDGAAQQWLLSPYVDEEVSLARAAFIKQAADGFGLSEEAFEAAAEQPSWLLDAVTNKQEILVEAYGGNEALNVTSLCLYSGPPEAEHGERSARLGALHYLPHPTQKLAWLGTGDAALKKPARLAALLKHYDHLLPMVGSLQLPHHGSDHNFHPDLVVAIDPSVVVAPAKSTKWRHPGSGVIHGLANFGLPLWNVTDAVLSETVETLSLG